MTMRGCGEEATQVKMSQPGLSSWNLIHTDGPWCLPAAYLIAQIRLQCPRCLNLAPEIHVLIAKQLV